LPIAFYLVIHWKGMKALSKMWYLILLLVSTVFTIMISWVDISDFIDSLKA
jgi:hypothetical protein